MFWSVGGFVSLALGLGVTLPAAGVPSSVMLFGVPEALKSRPLRSPAACVFSLSRASFASCGGFVRAAFMQRTRISPPRFNTIFVHAVWYWSFGRYSRHAILDTLKRQTYDERGLYHSNGKHSNIARILWKNYSGRNRELAGVYQSV